MKEQHSDMFVYGEKGSTFSLESMRREAIQRLERYGWTSTIHHHDSETKCGDDPAWPPCEQYFPEETEETIKTENLPDPVPPRIEDHTVASDPNYESIPWGHTNE